MTGQLGFLHVGYLGWEKAVDAQVEAMKASLAADFLEGVEIFEQDFEGDKNVRSEISQWRYGGLGVVKVVVKPADISKILETLPSLIKKVSVLPEFGVIWLGFDRGNSDGTIVLEKYLKTAIVGLNGAYFELQEGDVVNAGMAGSDGAVQEKIKKVFDPDGVFVSSKSMGGSHG